MSYPRERERSVSEFPIERGPVKVGTLETLNWRTGLPISTITYNASEPWGTRFHEFCGDELHKRRKPTLKSPGQYHEGGPLMVAKVKTIMDIAECDVLDEYWPLAPDHFPSSRFRCQMYPCFSPSAPSWSNEMDFADGDVTRYGAEGWRKAHPGRSYASLGEFIGEFRDIPRLLQARARHFRDLGGNYLNYKFGWVPFLSDLREFYALSQRIPEALAAIKRGNGKWHLRKRRVTRDIDVREWEDEGYMGFLPQTLNSKHWDTNDATRTCRGIATYERNVWFSGRFRYYIPLEEMETPYWEPNMIRKMYGLTATPDVVWELVRWSWLIDYFTNIGDVLANLSNGMFDDVVAKYAYIMGTTIYGQSSWNKAKPRNGPEIKGSITRTRIYKHRAAANPYGFDVDFTDLSKGQLAILVALGISRIR